MGNRSASCAMRALASHDVLAKQVGKDYLAPTYHDRRRPVYLSTNVEEVLCSRAFQHKTKSSTTLPP